MGLAKFSFLPIKDAVMENLKNIHKPQDVKLAQSQSQDKVPSEKEDLFESPSYPSEESIYHNVENEGLVDEDKIVHNGEGLDPEKFDERADVSIENQDKFESELDEEDE